MQRDLGEIIRELFDLIAFVGSDARRRFRIHADNKDALVQNFIVLEIVHERRRRHFCIARQEDRCARDTRRFGFFQHANEIAHRDRVTMRLGGKEARATQPGPHHQHNHAADQNRHPATFKQFEKVGGEEDALDDEKCTHRRQSAPQRPFPQTPENHKSQQGIDHHRSRHRNAVSGSQCARGFEQSDQQKHADQQGGVDPRNINLAFLLVRCVLDFQTRQEPKLNGLAREREGTCDRRLACNDRGNGRQNNERQQRPIRGHQEEGIFHRLRLCQKQSALTEIVQHQRRQHEERPSKLNGATAEVTHVGIERFRARDRKEDRAHHNKAQEPVREKEGQAMHRIKRVQNAWRIPNMRQAHGCKRQEPKHHNGTEESRHGSRATTLHHEQSDQNHEGDRQNIMIERRRDEFQTLHR